MDFKYIVEYLVAICMSITALFCKITGQDEDATEETINKVESTLNGIFD